jgi:hypothetical protein
MKITQVSTKRLREMLAATERAQGSGSQAARIIYNERQRRLRLSKRQKGVGRGR